jgi:uncharacterized membrane protein
MTTSEQIQRQEEGRGIMILVFGILSIFALGPILGIPAWIMGKNDLRKIQAGRIASTETQFTRTGMILGIIGTFLVFLVIFIGVGIAIIISMSTRQ